MESRDIVLIAEIVGALSVALTLIVLIVSIRQNTKAQKVVAVDSLAAAITSINVPLIGSPTVGSAVSKAVADWNTASRDERIMAHYFLYSFFRLVESAWYQQREGVLDRSQWLGWDAGIRKYYHSKGVREVWWPNRKSAYSKEFQDYLSQTSQADELGNLGDMFDYSRDDA